MDKLQHKESKVKWARMEYDVLRDLQHRSIVQVYDFKETSSALFLVLQLAKGGDLWRYMKTYKQHKHRMLPEKIVSKMIKSLLEGVHYIHERNIIHRDIKPGNFHLPHFHPERFLEVPVY